MKNGTMFWLERGNGVFDRSKNESSMFNVVLGLLGENDYVVQVHERVLSPEGW